MLKILKDHESTNRFPFGYEEFEFPFARAEILQLVFHSPKICDNEYLNMPEKVLIAYFYKLCIILLDENGYREQFRAHIVDQLLGTKFGLCVT